jgi:hypothetical protein
MKLLIIPICTLILVSSCTKDRDTRYLEKITDTIVIYPGIIMVNEIVAKGSTFINEYGMTSDWFELFNTSPQTINMSGGRWYVTDDLTNPRKYEMPAVAISPHGFLIVCCDGLNKYAQQIHSNFALSASGEQVGLFYANPDLSVMAIDTLSYPEMTDKGFSYGRLPDGSSNWTYFAQPTPGAQNHY